jgi:hypothetical protein
MNKEIVHTKDINDFRKEAIYYSNQGKRFRFLLESVVGCFGQCPGCAFTFEEKSNVKQPLMNAKDLPNLFNQMLYLIEYRQGIEGAALGGNIETTVINFGGAEHFIYDDNYLGALFEQTAIFFDKVPTKRNVLAFSSSGLMLPQKMYQNSRKMLQYLKKEQFVVDFVIDLSRFDRLKDNYKRSFDFFIENFGFVDLAINIEKNSDIRDWEAFCNFVDERGILNVDLIYALNTKNKHRVAIEANKFFSVYEKIVKSSKNGMHLFDINGFLRIKDNQEEFVKNLQNMSIKEVAEKAAKTIMSDAMFIDSNYNASPVMFGIFADIPLGERLDWKPVGNIFEKDFVVKWKNYEQEMVKKLIKINAISQQCSNCEFTKECYSTGLPYLNQYLNEWDGKKIKNQEECQNPIRPFLEAKKHKYLIPRQDEY